MAGPSLELFIYNDITQLKLCISKIMRHMRIVKYLKNNEITGKQKKNEKRKN